MGNQAGSFHSPARIIILSFLLTITLGTLALSLPIARTVDVSWLDLFFTATSATCVAGLFTVPLLGTFTFFGKCILLLLIQIGGLGLITMTLFFISLFMDFGFKTQLMAGKLLEVDSWKNIKQLLIFIVLVTLYAELIGALLIYTQLHGTMAAKDAWFLSVFQSVSSFCNAGISLFTERAEEVPHNNVILLVSTILMYVGGIGFVTWHEISRYVSSFFCEGKRYKFSLYSKIILYGSTSLLIATGVTYWLLERTTTLAHLSSVDTFIDCIFHAVSFKSAGFLIAAPASLQTATLLLILVISFIGSSPASTGSGIKISTFAVILATVRAALKSRTSIDIRNRRISIEQVLRAIAIIAFSIGTIMLVTFCLLISEIPLSDTSWGFMDLVFEVGTAFSSAGISLGLTSSLSVIGKWFIILTLIIGRVGSFTLALALKMRDKKETSEFTYPEERIMIG